LQYQAQPIEPPASEIQVQMAQDGNQYASQAYDPYQQQQQMQQLDSYQYV